MSDTEIELQPEAFPTPKGRRSQSSPAAEPVAKAPLAAAPREPTATAPTEPDAQAAVPLAAAGTSSAAATPRRRSRQPAAVGFPWEVSPLVQFPMAELLAEIDRRHARARVLLAERDRILVEMAALEAELGIVGPAVRSTAPAVQRALEPLPRRQRAKNSVSLADALAQAVEVRATVSPAEAAQLVLSNGYQSTAKNFGMVVANALGKDKRFRRTRRGQYERIAA